METIFYVHLGRKHVIVLIFIYFTVVELFFVLLSFFNIPLFV